MPTRRQLLFGKSGDPAGRRRESPGPEQLSLVIAFADTCLARRGVVCRSCGEACAAGAISFAPGAGGVAHPFAQNEHCTGCGDCLPLCPSTSLRLVPKAPGRVSDSPVRRSVA